jgi:CRP/FNR family transcriptional regulator, cyclic AMP receptor protein
VPPLTDTVEEIRVPATTTDTLRTIPLFQGMSDRSIDAIEALARPVTFQAGQTLVREGDPGDTFLIVLDGSAIVTTDGVAIRSLGAGDFLGEISLLDGGPRTATVTAESAVSALSIDRDGFRRLMDEFPVLRLDIVTALTHRLRSRAPELTD